MNILPDLNAAPVAPAAPSGVSSRSGFQASPDQPQTPSFTQTLALADQARQNASVTQSAQNNQTSQSEQNTQAEQVSQSAQNTQPAQNPDEAQTSASVGSPADASGKSADATTAPAKPAKSKTADDTAASADKAATDLLAFVASLADGKLTPQQQAANVTALPAAAPVVTDAIRTGGHTASKDGKTPAAAVDTTKQTPSDALDAKQGKGKQAATADSGDTLDAKGGSANGGDGHPAAAAGNAGRASETGAQQTNANTNAAQGAIASLQPGIGPQATADGQTPGSPNVTFSATLQQIGGVDKLAPAAADKLSPQVGAPGWDQALGQKVVWMTGNGQQTATLTLNPPDLGPMQVVVNVNKNQADASFIAANAEVKHALEAAMPKLREMLDQAGIQLGQASVSTGMPNQQQQAFNQQPQRQGGSGFGGSAGGDAAESTVTTAVAATSGEGLVDTFV
ncbi:MAG: fliK [Herbaspirillum sp.]|nr:fliK [Herbaspirillum sp.]